MQFNNINTMPNVAKLLLILMANINERYLGMLLATKRSDTNT